MIIVIIVCTVRHSLRQNDMHFQSDPDDETIVDLMRDHDLDLEDAEEVSEIMDEYGLDEDDAMELHDAM